MTPSASIFVSEGAPKSARFWKRIDAAGRSTSLPGLSIFGRFAPDYQFATEPNWDGQGAKALSLPVLRLAEQTISRYGGTDYLVEVAPGRDGSISFVWDDNKGNYIYLDVGPGDTIHLYYDAVGEAKWEGVSVASDPALLSRLRVAFAHLYSSQQVVCRFIQTAGSSPHQFRFGTV